MMFDRLDRAMQPGTRLQPILAVGGGEPLWREAAAHVAAHLAVTPADTVELTEVPSIALLRETLQRIQLKPLHGARTLVAAFHLDRWSPELMNTALKTVEEPPAHAAILLCAGSSSPILPTILSRVGVVRLPAQATLAEVPAALGGSVREAFAAAQALAEGDEPPVSLIGSWSAQAPTLAAKRSLLELAATVRGAPVNKRLALETAALLWRNGARA